MIVKHVKLTDLFGKKMEWMGENMQVDIYYDSDNERLDIKMFETPPGPRKSAEVKCVKMIS